MHFHTLTSSGGLHMSSSSDAYSSIISHRRPSKISHQQLFHSISDLLVKPRILMRIHLRKLSKNCPHCFICEIIQKMLHQQLLSVRSSKCVHFLNPGALHSDIECDRLHYLLIHGSETPHTVMLKTLGE